MTEAAFIAWLHFTVLGAAILLLGRIVRLRRWLKKGDVNWGGTAVLSVVIGALLTTIYQAYGPSEVALPPGEVEGVVILDESAPN